MDIELKPIFLFGTLRHLPLLRVVQGRCGETNYATVSDHAILQVKNAHYPVLCKKTGSLAEGLLLSNLSEYDVARLNFYENISDYFLKDIIVNTANNNVDAQCYFPKTDLKVGEFEWNLKLWKNSYGSEILTYATEVMELISTLSYQDAKIFTSEIEKRTLG
ncbi:MAG: ADP-ribose pyrophosphatase [Paracoccaceae bacterium]